jgi:hypothetical protein
VYAHVSKRNTGVERERGTVKHEICSRRELAFFRATRCINDFRQLVYSQLTPITHSSSLLILHIYVYKNSLTLYTSTMNLEVEVECAFETSATWPIPTLRSHPRTRLGYELHSI